MTSRPEERTFPHCDISDSSCSSYSSNSIDSSDSSDTVVALTHPAGHHRGTDQETDPAHLGTEDTH